MYECGVVDDCVAMLLALCQQYFDEIYSCCFAVIWNCKTEQVRIAFPIQIDQHTIPNLKT